MKTLEHYTLNTGHTRQSPRREVSGDVLPVIRPMLAQGEHRLPPAIGDGYKLVVPDCSAGGFLSTLYRDDIPLVTIGAADSPEAAAVVWPHLERLYLNITDQGLLAHVDFKAPRQPATLPWCAVVIVALHLDAEAAGWIGDFERCLAWTWLETSVNKTQH